ncbi:hypothetical protein VCUG_01970 [Vavraia culicis subsp. floridensis]|uniref:Uncharacterized protein n=1 Tax=Vavraia culicis (isolate floridensis) TaxID=948595 RepID=L2GT44_VAVCU|nr:uncharacterized protein VCUG_01970 [Vavraia culicis subsp. floridensis]ELA46537.1 hypothetical protein VCUG_01970 [Vavraia culicis subsp. floridensis]
MILMIYSVTTGAQNQCIATWPGTQRFFIAASTTVIPEWTDRFTIVSNKFLLGTVFNQLYHRYNTALSGKIIPIMELSPKGSFSTRNTVNISLASTNSGHNGYLSTEKQFCNSYSLYNMLLLRYYCQTNPSKVHSETTCRLLA